MKYEECKVGQKVWIRSVKDLRNEFDSEYLFDYEFLCMMFFYNETMFDRYAEGFLGEIVEVKSLDRTNVPIMVKTEYCGCDDIWGYKPEGLYLKEDV